MKQADKDRLFVLGLDVPESIEKAGEQAVDEWAAKVISAALLEGGEKAEQLLAIKSREDLGVYEEGGPAEGGLARVEPPETSESVADFEDSGTVPRPAVPQADGDPGPPTFTELLEAGGVTFDLIDLLQGIARTAAELAELAERRGPEAVNARLGILPAWPEFHAWAEAALTPAPDPAIALLEPDKPESAEEAPPAAEPELTEDLRQYLGQALAAQNDRLVALESRADAEADPDTEIWLQSYTKELARVREQIEALESRVDATEKDLAATDELTDRLELPLSGGPVTATPFPKEGR